MDELTRHAAAFWDTQASVFDDEPDHGLRDPATRAAWHERLRSWLPPAPATVADLGCGTGSLSVLMAADGYDVTGVDVSGAMLDVARIKTQAAGLRARFHLADAADPPLAPGSLDAVVVRHLVWTLPNPVAALRRWVDLLRSGGRLVLIEGRWAITEPSTDEPAPEQGGVTTGRVAGGDDPLKRLPWGSGVTAATLEDALRPLVDEVVVHDLAGDARLWGRAVGDERYAAVARLRGDAPQT